MLIALDVDGTLIHDDETASDRVADAVRTAQARGHEVMLATGRSWETAQIFHERFGLTSQFVVCSNGAVTMRRASTAGGDSGSASGGPGAVVSAGYVREFVETFDATEVLRVIHGHLPTGSFMVEDAAGFRRFTAGMQDWEVSNGQQVEFDDLAAHLATRVVVVSPDHDEVDFLAIVEQMGLHRVSYSVGWTAWLDIAPEGINKATALERVRAELGIPIEQTLAVGDGRNDIEMFEWAGRAVAMGQAPDEVKAVADSVTASIDDDGAAAVLETV